MKSMRGRYINGVNKRIGRQFLIIGIRAGRPEFFGKLLSPLPIPGGNGFQAGPARQGKGSGKLGSYLARTDNTPSVIFHDHEDKARRSDSIAPGWGLEPIFAKKFCKHYGFL
jgi:hypothetical protein